MTNNCRCGIRRREFLADVGMGFTGLALGAMLARDGVVRAETPGGAPAPNAPLDAVGPQFAPRAKSVIWLFMVGGTSHMESFDPKPALNKYAGKTIAETPFPDPLASEHLKKNLRELVPGLHHSHPKLYPMQVGSRKRGQSGIEISDWWPHLGECVDDLAIVRSMWTTDNDHGAQLQFHTGRHTLEGFFPDDRLVGALRPGFAQRRPAAVRRDGHAAWPIAAAAWADTGQVIWVPSTPACSLARIQRIRSPSPCPRRRCTARSNSASSSCSTGCNRLAQSRVSRRCGDASPHQVLRAGLPHADGRARGAALRGRNASDPRAVRPGSERRRRNSARQCLAARRLVEQGVRFVQIFHGSNGGAAHGTLTAI